MHSTKFTQMNNTNNNTTVSAVTYLGIVWLITLSIVSIIDNSKYLLPYQVGKLRSDLQCCNCDYVARPELCPLSSSTVSRGVTSSRIRTHRQTCVTSKSILCLKVSLTFSTRRQVTSHHHNNDKYSHEFCNWPREVKVVKPSAPL